ncbi:MAG TPA: hypothetical protein VG847_13205 [Chitinophagaceae bacterium]|nr:hypothetical protein [Chitinophagaceae bacterium]
MIHAMLEVDSEKDWWDELSSNAKKMIEQGMEDIKKGRVHSHNDVMKKYKEWL